MHVNTAWLKLGSTQSHGKYALSYVHFSPTIRKILLWNKHWRLFSFPGVLYANPCWDKPCHSYATCQVINGTEAVCVCPQNCTGPRKPVCGSNWKTYDSVCALMAESCAMNDWNSLRYNGECECHLYVGLSSVHTIQLCDLFHPIHFWWMLYSLLSCFVYGQQMNSGQCSTALSITHYIPYVRSELDPTKLDRVNRP